MVQVFLFPVFTAKSDPKIQTPVITMMRFWCVSWRMPVAETFASLTYFLYDHQVFITDLSFFSHAQLCSDFVQALSSYYVVVPALTECL